MYRWISYTAQNIPGSVSFELDRHTSIAAAKEAYVAYCNAVGTDDCHMTLYAMPADVTEQMWASAKEFEGVGCPFDYPDRLIERGPLGGVVVNRT